MRVAPWIAAVALVACAEAPRVDDVDSGVVAADAGQGSADAGQGSADAGFSAADAGPDSEDAGELTPEAGSADAEAIDTGLSPDGGTPLVLRNYLAFGSSSTVGTGASMPDRAYVERIFAALAARFPALVRTNFAVGGGRVGQFEARIPEMVRLAPEIVTVLPFTDYVQTATATFRAGYARIFDALAPTGATIFFGDNRIDPALVCTDPGQGGCYPAATAATLAAKSAILSELAATRPYVIIVPIFDQNGAHPEWYANGHPNDLGHQYLADRFLEVINPWLAR